MVNDVYSNKNISKMNLRSYLAHEMEHGTFDRRQVELEKIELKEN